MSLFSDVFGGGNSGAVTESVPAWLRPYMEKAAGSATSAYDAGELSKVAGKNLNLNTGFGMGSTISDTATSGLDTLQDQQARLLEQAQTGGRADLQAALDQNLGRATAKVGQDYGASGTLGSARQSLAEGTAKGAIIADNEKTIMANKAAGEAALSGNVGNQTGLTTGTASALTNLGSAERGVDQSQLDSTWQGIQRMSSAVYGNPAKQTAMGGK